MNIVDIIFGKRLKGSFYHLETQIFNRSTFDTPLDLLNLIQDTLSSVSGEVEDEVEFTINSILEQVKVLEKNPTELDQNALEVINQKFAFLSLQGYEFYAIIRRDLEAIGTSQSADRTYALNIRIPTELPGLNRVYVGMSNAFAKKAGANRTSMVMEFIYQKKIFVGDEEELSSINFPSLLESYLIYSRVNEAYLLDVSDLTHYLEERGYRFLLALNSTPDTIEDLS